MFSSLLALQSPGSSGRRYHILGATDIRIRQVPTNDNDIKLPEVENVISNVGSQTCPVGRPLVILKVNVYM